MYLHKADRQPLVGRAHTETIIGIGPPKTAASTRRRPGPGQFFRLAAVPAVKSFAGERLSCATVKALSCRACSDSPTWTVLPSTLAHGHLPQ